jgi:hypothetical protein
MTKMLQVPVTGGEQRCVNIDSTSCGMQRRMRMDIGGSRDVLHTLLSTEVQEYNSSCGGAGIGRVQE